MKRKNYISTAVSAIGTILGLVIYQLFLMYRHQLPAYSELVKTKPYIGLENEILTNMIVGEIKIALSLSIYAVPIIMLIIFFYGSYIYEKLKAISKLNAINFLGSAIVTSLLIATLLTNRRFDTYFLCVSLAFFPALFYFYAMAYQNKRNA